MPNETPRTKFIWIASYPKSGNTWMRLLLRHYFLETTGEEPFEDSDTSPYWYQTVSAKPLHACIPQDIMQIRPAALAHLTTVYENRKRGRDAAVIKTHLASGDLLGVPFFSPLWVDYAVYIHRDPRDVLPSLADHMGMTLEDAATLMGNPKAQIGDLPKIPTLLSSWSEHVRSWMGRRGDGQRVSTCVTSYERLHEDTARELAAVLRFCEIEPDMEAVEAAVEACRFERLQAREAEEGFIERTDNQEKFFRRGIVGAWKDEVPHDLLGKIEKDHLLTMKMLGYV